jgi:hypothetical protein
MERYQIEDRGFQFLARASASNIRLRDIDAGFVQVSDEKYPAEPRNVRATGQGAEEVVASRSGLTPAIEVPTTATPLRSLPGEQGAQGPERGVIRSAPLACHSSSTIVASS